MLLPFPGLLSLIVASSLCLASPMTMAREHPHGMSPENTVTALSSGSPPLVLDVRGRAEAANATIAGAINAGRDAEAFRPDGTGNWAILIAPWPPEPSLIDAWKRRLESFGYEVTLLEGGFPAWRDANLPVETKVGPLTKPGSVPFTIPRGLCEANTPAQIFK